MAKYQREATQYPGVFWLTIQGVKTLYIRYKRPGTYKTIEEKLGSEKNWTASQGNGERVRRIAEGDQMLRSVSSERQQNLQRNLDRPLIDYGKLIWSLRALRLKV